MRWSRMSLDEHDENYNIYYAIEGVERKLAKLKNYIRGKDAEGVSVHDPISKVKKVTIILTETGGQTVRIDHHGVPGIMDMI